MAAALMLASCSAADADPEPGEATVGEARALEQASEMLDERPAASEGSAAERTPSPAASATPRQP